MFAPLFLLILLGAIALYFFDTLKARDIAVAAAREACASEGLQFLDDSVVLRKQRPGRDHAGVLRLQRTFSFEYSDTGNNRLPGSVTVMGLRATEVSTAWRAPLDPI